MKIPPLSPPAISCLHLALFWYCGRFLFRNLSDNVFNSTLDDSNAKMKRNVHHAHFYQDLRYHSVCWCCRCLMLLMIRFLNILSIFYRKLPIYLDIKLLDYKAAQQLKKWLILQKQFTLKSHNCHGPLTNLTLA